LSARTRPALWQRLVVLLGAVALALAVALAPFEWEKTEHGLGVRGSANNASAC
jgi:hypothetical protein